MKEQGLKIIDELIVEYMPKEFTETDRDYSEGIEALEKLREKVGQIEPPVMRKIAGTRYLPKQEPRVETGVLQFGDDWQGLFLRGDYCMDLLIKLSKLLNGDIQPIEKEVVYDFHELLKQVKE